MTELKILGLTYGSSIILIGILMSFIQKMSRKPFILGVSLPLYMEEDPEIKAALKTFKRNTIILGIILAIIQYSLIYITNSVSLNTLAFIILLFTLFIPYFIGHNKIKAFKKGRNIEPNETIIKPTNLTVDKYELKKDLILLYLPSLIIIIASAIWIYLNYERFPDMIASHVDFNNQVTGFRAKSHFNVQLPTMLSLLMWLTMFFTNIATLKSKYKIRSDMKELAYANFMKARKIWTYFLGISNLLLVVLMDIGIIYIFNLENYGFSNIFAITTIILSLLMTIVAIYISIKVGVDGSKLSDKPLNEYIDNDEFWHLGGTIYYNPDDSSNFVYKRMGAGVTIEESFTATIAQSLLMLGTIPGIIIINRMFEEEKLGRLAQVYSTQVKRGEIYWTNI